MSNIDFQNGLIAGMLLAGKRHISVNGYGSKYFIDRKFFEVLPISSIPMNDILFEIEYPPYPIPLEPTPYGGSLGETLNLDFSIEDDLKITFL